jgi:hypothetical protein
MRSLRRLVEARRDLVHDRVQVTNRLNFTLKGYFPQILDWFCDKETEVFAAFLYRWPSLQDAQRARHDTIVAFFHSHNVRRADVVERRTLAIKTEMPLTSDPAVIEPAHHIVAALLPQLRALSAGIAPVTERSGNKHWVHWRHKAKGASHNATIRALAFKWIRILFRFWVDRTPYNESRYLAALQKRHSPILKFAAQDPS